MTGWIRASYNFTHRMALTNSVLVRDIYHMIRSCEAGQRPVYNQHPFINIRSVYPEERDPYRSAAHEAATIAAEANTGPFLQSIWIKDGCMGRYVMSRTWIHERNRSLYWLTAIQMTDNPGRYLNMESMWFPYCWRQKGDRADTSVGA